MKVFTSKFLVRLMLVGTLGLLMLGQQQAFALETGIAPFYFSGKVGVAAMSASNISNTSSVAGTPATVSRQDVGKTVMPFGGAIGYNWHKHGVDLRTEVEFMARTNFAHNSNPTFTNAGTPTKFTSSMASKTIFANVYYDFVNTTNFTPFIGGGLGLAINNSATDGQTTAGTSSSHSDQRNTKFAWNLGGGVGYSLTDHITLDVTYRYADLGRAVWGNPDAQVTAKTLDSHEFLFGARYQF